MHTRRAGGLLGAFFAVLATAGGAGAACSGSRPCVAILDSGIDAAHPDFSGTSITFRDFTTPGGAVRDDLGHGTAVASRVAGRGTCVLGAAPGADLVIGKVNLPGDREAVVLDAVRAGIEWAVAQGARVINLSLGGPDVGGGAFGVGPDGVVLGQNEVEQAIRAAASAGVVTVVAVGNTYVLSSELNTPPNAVEALVVGAAATDGTPKAPPLRASEDAVAVDPERDTTFSDLDPHVTAVGSAERPMARAAGQDMAGAAEPVRPGGSPDPDGICVRAAGTSFAAPWAAGLAARLRHEYRGGSGGGELARYLVRLVQRTAIDTASPYPAEGFGFVERPEVAAAAVAHARAGILPAAPEPNETFRTVSDALRGIH